MCEEDKENNEIDKVIDAISKGKEEKITVIMKNLMESILDMPKLQSPFVRGMNEEDHYTVTSMVTSRFEWIFEKGVIAIEKLDGTSVSIVVKNHDIIAIFNRTNRIPFWVKGGFRFVEGLQKAIERDYLKLNELDDGQYFGELIGPNVNGNPYKLDMHLWMPFLYLKEHYEYKFWNKDIVPLCAGKSDEERYEIIKEVFEGLWSLYKRKRSKTIDFGDVKDVNKDLGFEGMSAEGIVFYPPEWDGDYSKCCELRRDMWSWFSGERHHI